MISRLSASWRQALPQVLVLTAWILFWYWGTAVAMVEIWARSETYTHAFVVPPIAFWLIWRQRASVLTEQPRAWLLLVIPVAVASIFWLLGELTAVNALTQFALVATLVLAIMALLGVAVSKRIAFPLAFLFFSVPIGDFMMPKLMEWTATFTILALRATGIPVYQEGLQFVIPSGNWSVVEACSGIRYIIASVTVGTLFAYLNYVTLRRRILFIVISFIVPVVANWLRAYMIVMIGHLSGNTLATGVDHLIYGWVFFGIVIMTMFAIGAKWSETAPEEKNPTKHAAPPGDASSSWLVMLMIAVLAATGPLAYLAISNADKAAPATFGQFTAPPGWAAAPAFTRWKPAYKNPSATLQSTFDNGKGPVGLYIGYYRNQAYGRKLITSTNALVTSEDRLWSVVSRGTYPAKVIDAPLPVRTAMILSKEDVLESRFVVWQWYWINGQLTTSDVAAKLMTALSRLRGQGDDSAVVMLYAPAEIAPASLAAFAESAAPQIQQLLTTAREAR